MTLRNEMHGNRQGEKYVFALAVELKMQSAKIKLTEHRCPMIPCVPRSRGLLGIALTMVPQLVKLANVCNLSTKEAKLGGYVEFEDNLATEQDTTLKSNKKENKICCVIPS